MKTTIVTIGIAYLFGYMAASNAAEITFDEVVEGAISYAYDGDEDGIDDVLFSTTDSEGFNTVGPGPSMNFINEPGIEGTTTLSEDLRVDFFFGASSNVTFGFAMSTTQETFGVTFEVYDYSDNLITSTFQVAKYTNIMVDSSFPEALLSIDFEGIAAYGLFKFDEEPLRYIIDNFKGDFGSRPDEQSAVITSFEIVPEGCVLGWTTLAGLDSVVKCSPNMVYEPFTNTSIVLPYPQNSYTDTVHNADSKCFYRVDLVH